MARLRYLQNKRSGAAGTIVKSTGKLYFYDDGMYIYASADGALEIVSDTSITLTAPTVNTTSSTVSAFTYPITISPTAAGTFLDFELETEWVSGTLINADFASATTLTGAAKGINLNFSGVHADSDQDITAIDLTFPDLALAAVSKTIKGIEISGDTITQTSSGSSVWTGLDITIPTMVETGGKLTATGVKIVGGTCTTDPITYGIALSGTFETAGINIEGTHVLALGIGSTTALTTATTGKSAVKVQSAFSATTGYHVGAWFVGNYTGAGAAGGSVYALRGHVAVTGTQTTVGAEAFIVGVHGRCAVTGTAYNSSAVYAGVLAQMLGGGTWTAANKVYALWVDNQLATNPTSGTVAMVGIRQNNNSGTAVVDHVFDIYGANIANFINFDSCISSGFVSSGSVGSTAIHKTACKTIKILIDGVDYYLIASTVVESS